MKEETRELNWLLEIGVLATPTQGRPPQLKDSRERLAQMMCASVEHLECRLGALIIPETNVRLVRRSGPQEHPSAEGALGRWEARLLEWVRLKKVPALLNQAGAGNGCADQLRLIAVPLAAGTPSREGALLFLRSASDPVFTPDQLAVAKHLGCHFSALLGTDLDLATGLYTRVGVHRRLEACGSPGRAVVTPHALICLDIDRLHVVNKVSGFEAGDALIARVAHLLKESHVPPGAIGARICGNEFALVLPNSTVEAAEHTARALQQQAARLSQEVLSAEEAISFSCGIASFTDPSEFERGLALAELACQSAKDHGRGRIEIYQDNDASMIRRRTDIVAVQLLREALRDNRLTLYAQRIMRLDRQEEVGGYELLLRTLDGSSENCAPAALLAAALHSELAPELDLWVIQRALSEALPYRREVVAANISLSINIAAPSLTDDRFIDKVRVLIRQSVLPASQIIFEMTETVALLSLGKAATFIQELRTLGCRFALDDFGTGANSLKNLTHLPVDRVKIDGSFVADLLTNPQSVAMVRGIVSLARDFGITTVAEYAESRQIIERLRELGVEYAQGYGIDKPRPVAQVLSELQARQHELHDRP